MSAKFALATLTSATYLVQPNSVTIPQLTTTGALGVGKPILTKHGLIQVEVPVARPATPLSIASATTYTVGAPKKGKVVDQTEPSFFCKKEGFVLEDGNQCVKVELAEARFVCAPGFEFFNGECLRRTTYLQSCPEGYQTRDGTCAKVVTAEAIPTCPEGSYEVGPGMCERQAEQQLVPRCEEGTYDGANCIVHTYAEARAFCPEGFSFFDGACIQEETYDCTKHPYAHAHSTHVHAPLGQAVPRQLTVVPQHPCVQAHLGLASRGPCPSTKVVLQPTHTTVSVQKTCTRVTSTALVFACDEGVLQGQKCLIRTPVPPSMICKHQSDGHGCYSTHKVTPLSVCPPNYTRECSGGRCECAALEAAAFVQSCPSGFDENEDGCVRTATANIVCPGGYTLQGEACVRTLREPADCVFSVTYECDRSSGFQC